MDPFAYLMGAVSGIVAAGLAALLIGWPWLRRRTLELARADLRRDADVAAKEALYRERDAFEGAVDATRRELKELEDRLRAREDLIDRRLTAVEGREGEARRREAELTGRDATLRAERAEVDQLVDRQTRELERIAGLRREEAERELLARVEATAQAELLATAERAAAEAERQADERTRRALVAALDRAAWPQPSEALALAVPLARDDLKALLVGRDGRNARAFEAATGATLLVDDTPGAVVVSCFDPLRRELARRLLERLLADGRVHPERIEEEAQACRLELEASIEGLGREAAAEAQAGELPPRLLALVGRLEFHTVEGASLRRHAVEVARLAGLLAAELGLDAAVARRAGLLHDIGRGLDDAAPGGHAEAGAEAARRAGEAPEVVEAVLAHELDRGPSPGPEAACVRIANRWAARRPGARDGLLEQAVRRRAEAEAIALRQPGVARAWAVQGGRALHVVVDPARVSEKAASRLARDVARALEQAELGPGDVEVTVVRETRHEAP